MKSYCDQLNAFYFVNNSLSEFSKSLVWSSLESGRFKLRLFNKIITQVLFHLAYERRPIHGRRLSPPEKREAKTEVRAWLHGGGGPQIGEVTSGGSPLHLSCKMRDYMDRRVTSPTSGPPPPCKQALSLRSQAIFHPGPRTMNWMGRCFSLGF